MQHADVQQARIRQASRSDSEALGALWMALLNEQAVHDDRFALAADALERWRNDFPEWLYDERRRILVAEGNGTLLGFVVAQRWAPSPIYAASSEIFIDELYVCPEVRGGGLGTRLVDGIKAWATSLQADRLRLRVLVANDAGQAFWKAQGARPFATTLTVEMEGVPSEEANREKKEKARLGF